MLRGWIYKYFSEVRKSFWQQFRPSFAWSQRRSGRLLQQWRETKSWRDHLRLFTAVLISLKETPAGLSKSDWRSADWRSEYSSYRSSVTESLAFWTVLNTQTHTRIGITHGLFPSQGSHPAWGKLTFAKNNFLTQSLAIAEGWRKRSCLSFLFKAKGKKNPKMWKTVFASFAGLYKSCHM